MTTRTRIRSRITKWIHLLLAVLIVNQMVMSLVMEPPNPRRGHAGNLWWFIHEYGGLVTFIAVCSFWAWGIVRRSGETPVSDWFPWFCARRREALVEDIVRHVHAILRWRLPDPESGSALPAAIQGLGLLLISALAVTGSAWWVTHQIFGVTRAVHWLIKIHAIFGNLVWFYLGLHVGAALLHEFYGHRLLRTMSPLE